MGTFFATFGAAGTLFIVVVCILWVILPFAVFGIKKRLDAIIIISKGIRNELKEINNKNRQSEQ